MRRLGAKVSLRLTKVGNVNQHRRMTPIDHSVKRVRAWLDSGDMTQEEIAKKAGVTRMTLFNIRTRRKRHSTELISRIEALIPPDFQPANGGQP